MRCYVKPFVILLLCISCTVDEIIGDNDYSSLETKSNIIENKTEDYFSVTLDDIYSTLSREESSKHIKSVETIETDFGNIAYIVNYSDGWKILSGDKRMAPVIAFSDTGCFDKDALSSNGINLWFSDYEAEFNSVRNSQSDVNQEETFRNKVEHVNNLRDSNLWTKITTVSTTSGYSSQYEADLTSKWGPDFPWNKKCPLDNNIYGSSPRCLLGCATVAISQLVYYYHYKYGVPSGLWESIDCSSYSIVPTPARFYNNHVIFPYSIDLIRSNFVSNSTRWNNMNTGISLEHGYNYYQDSTKYNNVIDLIMDVGDRLDTKYSYYAGSSADSTHIANVLPYYGLDGTISSFNDAIIVSNLSQLKPMAVMGSTQNGVDNVWVLDGYKVYTTQTATTYTYYLGYKEGIGEPVTRAEAIEAAELCGLDKPEDGMSYTDYANPINTKYYRMTWGLDGQYDGYYQYGSFRGYNYDLYLLHDIVIQNE